jgi:hypothetical protein
MRSLRDTQMEIARMPRPQGRNWRMAGRLDQVAEAAATEAARLLREGDGTSARMAWDRAASARRAARMLRAGPGGVRDVLDPPRAA